MCTCINFKTKDNYFGRNMDIEYRFGEGVVITPRNYEFKLKNGNVITTKYAMIGMASVVSGYPLYAEASNEAGLSMAGLYFPHNACFFDEDGDKLNLTPYELIPYFLGQYKSVSEIRSDINNLNITNIPFAPNLPIASLHWMISDGDEVIVLEQMKDGLKVYDNEIGVLTNNPPFDKQLENLKEYINLTPYNKEKSDSKNIDLSLYGQGMGAVGLPGDSSPSSRFVRAYFNKIHSKCNEDEESSVTQFFHILDSVLMVQGSVITDTDKFDITTYSSCINTTKGVYYYKTYTNNQITAIKMNEEDKVKNELSIYDLVDEQQIKYING